MEPVLSDTAEAPAGAAHICENCGTEYAEGDSCPACGALRDPEALAIVFS